MSLERMREELRRRYERLRKREEERRKVMLKYYEPIKPEAPPLIPPLKRKELRTSNPNELDRVEVLDLLISVLREHEKTLDELIEKGSLAVETQTGRLEDLLFRLEDAVSRLERIT